MIAKRTDSIGWRSAQQLKGGFATLATAPSALTKERVYFSMARSHPACEAGNPLAHGCSNSFTRSHALGCLLQF